MLLQRSRKKEYNDRVGLGCRVRNCLSLGMNDWDYETSKRNRDYGIRFVDDIHDARGKTLVRDDMWRAKAVLSPALPKGTHKLWRSGARSTTETKQKGLF